MQNDDRTTDANGEARQATEDAAGTADQAIKKAYVADTVPAETTEDDEGASADRAFAGDKPADQRADAEAESEETMDSAALGEDEEDDEGDIEDDGDPRPVV